jgi:hypothetical protein
VTQLVLSPQVVSMTVPEGIAGGTLVLPGLDPARLIAARLDGAALAWRAEGDGVAVDLQPGRFSLHLLSDR